MAVARGYQQSPEHVRRRTRRGERHYHWSGDAVSERGGRARALRAFPAGPCERCGSVGGERHHRDGNTANNAPSNIRMLCRRCHMGEDGRLASFTADARSRVPGLIAAAAVARRSRATCKRGHPLSGDNLYINPRGARICKECRKLHKQRARDKEGRTDGGR